MPSNKTIIAFDLYGTLLSTESIADELGLIFGADKGPSLATLWRRYQLEYTWRIDSMGLYRSFSQITKGALHHAVAESGLSISDTDTDRLMKAYDSLHIFPDIPSALTTVKENPRIEAYIFSNGTPEMVGASVHGSGDLKAYADAGLFRGFVTVHELEVFKPAKATYDHLLKSVGKEDKPGEVWVVTANPFDAVGARVAGLRSAWIDRAGKGWVDRLGDVLGDIRPSVVSPNVDEAIRTILETSAG